MTETLIPIAVITISILFTVTVFFIFQKRPTKFNVFLKAIAVIYTVIVFFSYFLPDGFVWVINGSFYGGVYYDRIDLTQTFLRWMLNISTVVLPVAVFCRNRLLKNIAIYICLPFTILVAINAGDFIAYFIDPTGRGIANSVHISPGFRQLIFNQSFRTIYFAAQLILGMVIPLCLFFIGKHRFNLKDRIERTHFLAALPFVILSGMPTYTLQSMFGFSGGRSGGYSTAHMIWILLLIMELIAIYVIFHKKDYRTRYELCVYLAFQLFMHYNSTYMMGFEFTKLPLQLCNLGAYFFLIVVIFKRKHLFYFAYIANIVGSTIAIVAPDVEEGYFSFWYIHFIIEHMQVFAVPVIIGYLGIFPPIQRKNLLDVFIGFPTYFCFCLILGTILNGIALKTGDTSYKVNYFYLFDLKKGFEYFPFIGIFGKPVVIFKYYTLYPFFQTGVFILYSSLCVICFFINEKMYAMAKDHRELRKVRQDLIKRWKQYRNLKLANQEGIR
jgi:uncharacterized membrane protein YwaF